MVSRWSATQEIIEVNGFDGVWAFLPYLEIQWHSSTSSPNVTGHEQKKTQLILRLSQLLHGSCLFLPNVTCKLNRLSQQESADHRWYLWRTRGPIWALFVNVVTSGGIYINIFLKLCPHCHSVDFTFCLLFCLHISWRRTFNFLFNFILRRPTAYQCNNGF